MSDDDPLITAVIGTYNGASTLGATLDALAAQRHTASFEVIVVDDASTDHTRLVADKAGVQVISLATNAGHSNTLNVGLHAARGRYMAMLDDDCVPPENWIQTLADIWSALDETVTMLGGPVAPLSADTFNRRYVAFRKPLHPQEAELDDRASLLVRLRFAFDLVAEPAGARPVYFPVGANMSVRVAAARAVGGFQQERGAGEEESIARPLRRAHGSQTVRYFPELVMRHDFRPEFSDSLRRARSYGRARGREWIHDHDVPSLQPRPVVAALTSIVVGIVSVPLALVTLALMPLVLYRRWISAFTSSRRLEVLAYPYSQTLEDACNILGFGEGALHEIRARRSPDGDVVDPR